MGSVDEKEKDEEKEGRGGRRKMERYIVLITSEYMSQSSTCVM